MFIYTQEAQAVMAITHTHIRISTFPKDIQVVMVDQAAQVDQADQEDQADQVAQVREMQ
jgi:hypothetical protein